MQFVETRAILQASSSEPSLRIARLLTNYMPDPSASFF
jgi:hypothetical protein